MLSQGLDYLAMISRELKKRERIKRNKRDHMDLMESNGFTYKEYDEYNLLRVDKHSFGHRCN